MGESLLKQTNAHFTNDQIGQMFLDKVNKMLQHQMHLCGEHFGFKCFSFNDFSTLALVKLKTIYNNNIFFFFNFKCLESSFRSELQ